MQATPPPDDTAPDPATAPPARTGWPARLGLDRPHVALLFFAGALGCGLLLTGLWVLRQPDPDAPPPAVAADSGGLPPPRVAPLPAPSSQPLDLPPLAPPVREEIEDEPPLAAAPLPPEDDFDRSGWERIGPGPAEPPAGAATATATTRSASPRADASPPPPYPSRALRRREQGETVLSVSVDADGRANRVRVIRSSGSRTLDNAAQAAVRRWRFEPAMRDGQPVEDEIQIPIGFSID
ncbi:energy transducer TonB [Coralloluteibacterium thermophilus]|uniref:Protein TonB n=1 Tax=Coralloluteibacterium thermophilum TaxID=2707049 RepID=A0ABV9NJ07_9GAMM